MYAFCAWRLHPGFTVYLHRETLSGPAPPQKKKNELSLCHNKPSIATKEM